MTAPPAPAGYYPPPENAAVQGYAPGPVPPPYTAQPYPPPQPGYQQQPYAQQPYPQQPYPQQPYPQQPYQQQPVYVTQPPPQQTHVYHTNQQKDTSAEDCALGALCMACLCCCLMAD